MSTTKQKLEVAMQVAAQFGLSGSNRAIARLSSMTPRTVSKHITNSTTNCVHIVGRNICTQEVVSFRGKALCGGSFKGVTELVGSNLFNVASFLIAAVVRLEGDLPENSTYRNMANFGSHYAELLVRADTARWTGGGIYSRWLPLRNLQRVDGFHKWFTKAGGYEVDAQSTKYSVTPYGMNVWRTAITLFTTFDFPRSDAKHGFTLALTDLPYVYPYDLKKLLTKAVGVRDGYLLLNDACKPSVSDVNGLTRQYGLGTSISSETRLQMGLIGYDVSACFQAIAITRCLPSIETTEHELFISSPKEYRQKIADAEGISYAKAKVAITRITFGGANHFEALRAYADEEARISESVLNMALLADDGRYDDAYDMRERKGDGDNNTILFHLLAMDEKIIRDAMSSCFDVYPMQVHDAVYSYQDINVEALEEAVRKVGFIVKIKKEVKV